MAKCRLLAELLEKGAAREDLGRQFELVINSENDRFIFVSGRKTIYFSSFLNLVKWSAPALLTYGLARWMVHFYKTANLEGAATCKELLLLLAGGTLGWIAKDRTSG